MLIIIITYKLTHSLSHVNLFYTHTNRLGFAMSMQDYFKMFYSLLKFIISNNIECFLFSYLRFKHKLVFKNLFLVYIPGVINISKSPNCYNNELVGADYIFWKTTTVIKYFFLLLRSNKMFLTNTKRRTHCIKYSISLAGCRDVFMHM